MNKNLAMGMRTHKERTHRHSKKMWMADAFKNAKGQLRKKTGAKKGKPIQGAALEEAAESENPKTRKQAQLALTARRINAGR